MLINWTFVNQVTKKIKWLQVGLHEMDAYYFSKTLGYTTASIEPTLQIILTARKRRF
jgi:hypothetical protein